MRNETYNPCLESFEELRYKMFVSLSTHKLELCAKHKEHQ